VEAGRTARSPALVFVFSLPGGFAESSVFANVRVHIAGFPDARQN